jgi:hypothetical protein
MSFPQSRYPFSKSGKTKNLDYIEFDLQLGNTTVKRKQRIFDPTRHNKWEVLEVQREWEASCELAGWNDGITQENSLRHILIREAYTLYENFRQQLGAASTDNVSLALESTVEQLLGRHPRRELRVMLEEPKSRQLSVQEHAIRYRNLQDLITYLPNGNNTPMPVEDQLDLYIRAMPKTWQQAYYMSGQRFTSLQEAITYTNQKPKPESKSRPKYISKSATNSNKPLPKSRQTN